MPALTTAIGPADARALSRPLFERLRSLDEGTAEYSYVRNTLVELNLWLVRHALRRFRPRRELYEDLLQVGTIGLIRAINRFDPARGPAFEAFAVPTVVGEVKRFFRDTTWAVHVPRRLQEYRTVLLTAATAFEQERGHAPTVADLAGRTALSEEEVAEGLRAIVGYDSVSLDAPAGAADGDGVVADRLGGDDPALARADDMAVLRPLIDALPERDRAILGMRFLRDMTQSQIGAELGISQMQVSRLLTRILERLRAQLSDGT